MNKKLLFLINPYAGRAEIKSRLIEIIDLFVRNSYEVTVHTTQKPNEIPLIIRNRGSSFDVIAACGGDGTLNETINGVMSLSERPLIGYIPTGTVNDFADNLNIPVSMLEAAELIVSGEEYSLDIGELNSKYFAYVAAFGAFSHISYRTSQQSKNIWGKAAYVFEGIRSLPSIKPIQVKYRTSELSGEDEFVLGMVTNSSSVAGIHLQNLSDSSLSDGLLEVTLVKKPKNFSETQQILNSVLRQDMSSASDSVIFCRTDFINFAFQKPVAWTTDGEYGGTVQSADISIKQQAVRFIGNREFG